MGETVESGRGTELERKRGKEMRLDKGETGRERDRKES